jgi:flavin reductase (DIM6/NTAB) family NADH-FMN oxidoreductase RutF
MDAQAKKTVLRMIPYGVYLLGVKHGEQLNASTVCWLSQASFTPPLIMVGVKADTLTLTMVEASRQFAVNLLADKQTEMAQAFFKQAEYKDGRLSGYAFQPGPVTGAPLLLEAAAWLECRVVDSIKRGDHTVVVAEVVEAGVRDAQATPMLLRNTPWQYGG